jgi:hypothetical protein
MIWVPGAHVRFGNLNFFVTMEGELAQAPAPVQPLHSASIDTIVEALEELHLHALEVRALESDQLLDFDYERMECQLDAFLGPHRPRRTCVTSLSCSPMS